MTFSRFAFLSMRLIALASDGRAQDEAFEVSPLIPGAELERVATGFQFTEGPAWSPAGFLLFTDVPASRIVRWDSENGITTFLEPSGRANGLMFDVQGNLVACQGEARRLVRIDAETKDLTVLADAYDDKKLNSPNDLAIDGDGGVYFTDPRYGQGEPLEQDVMGVYHVDTEGRIGRVIDDLPRPNGVRVSPDGAFLYVANPNLRQIVRYPIEGSGELGEGTVWFTGDETEDGYGPDGMAIDERGNVYATYRSLVVLDVTGQVIERVTVPEKPSNCAFGGKEAKTLFITARTSLYALPTAVRGMGLPSKGVPTTEVEVGALTLLVPETWTFSEPTSTMRLGQFVVPGEGGDAELVVYYFGQAGAGTVQANVARWIGQFEEDGRTTRIARGECPSGSYAVVTCHGTYNQPVGPPIRRQFQATPGSAMIAIIVPTDRGDHYLKLTGPAKTVDAASRAMRVAISARGKESLVELGDLRP